LKTQEIITLINSYYTNKISEYGPQANGVDWNGKESQYLRFEQLSKVFLGSLNEPLSITDFGCGYGEYVNYLKKQKITFEYLGLDISEKMLEFAQLHFNGPNIKFMKNIEDCENRDYLIASGVFNVRQDLNDKEWKFFIESNLISFNQHTQKGFSFNLLTSYSDNFHMKDYLYYADPLYFFDFCKKKFSNNVALLHDYNLHEFTLIVRK